jgi:hypothetical protein
LRSVGEREMVPGRRKMVLRPMSQMGPKADLEPRILKVRHINSEHWPKRPSGLFLLKKLKILRVNQAHRSAGEVTERFEHPHHGLERTHSLMVIGASGQNQISVLATQCLL